MHTHISKMARVRNVHNELSPITMVLLVVIMLNILLPMCFSMIVRLPLRRAVALEEGNVIDSSIARHTRNLEAVTQHIQGISGEGYYIDFNVGTPPQRMQVLVDTGSSNFALAASPDPHISHYFVSNNSSTYIDENSVISVPYTQGEWEGKQGSDIISMDSLPNVTVRATIAFITKSSGFFIPESNWQGIVGFAYQSISRPTSLVPFWDALRTEAGLEDIFSMQLCGASLIHNKSKLPSMEGNMVLGGISEDLYTGRIFYTPIVREMYYEVVISDISVAGTSLSMDCKEYNYDKTIVDSGTTHLRLPSRVFKKLVSAIKLSLSSELFSVFLKESFWTGEDLFCSGDLTAAFNTFPNVSISLVLSENSSMYFTLHLSPQYYLRYVDDVKMFGTSPTCLKFGISPSESGTVLGALLMESFFVIFDRRNKQIGFANTKCLPHKLDGHASFKTIDGPHTALGNLTRCQYMRAVEDQSTLLVITYVMVAICVVCAMPLLVLCIQWQLRKASERWKLKNQDSDAQTVLTDSTNR